MTLAEIIRNGKGKAGSGGNWQAFSNGDGSRELWHYSTLMLKWTTDGELLDYSIGHGSVSDQGGMQTAFKVLNLPYRYDRDQRGGGPRITAL